LKQGDKAIPSADEIRYSFILIFQAVTTCIPDITFTVLIQAESHHLVVGNLPVPDNDVKKGEIQFTLYPAQGDSGNLSGFAIIITKSQIWILFE